jgi:hypothetical protein
MNKRRRWKAARRRREKKLAEWKRLIVGCVRLPSTLNQQQYQAEIASWERPRQLVFTKRDYRGGGYDHWSRPVVTPPQTEGR